MRNILFLFVVAAVCSLTACSKYNLSDAIPDNFPRTEVSADLQHLWMYGNFSTTEYWTQNPATYIGNALEVAIAFQFKANGTYTHYFTSSSVLGGSVTYNQSVTVGTVEIDTVAHTITTHPFKAHYKQTGNGQTLEDRDLEKDEITSAATYTYSTGVEDSGTNALYLKLGINANAITFLQKQ